MNELIRNHLDRHGVVRDELEQHCEALGKRAKQNRMAIAEGRIPWLPEKEKRQGFGIMDKLYSSLSDSLVEMKRLAQDQGNAPCIDAVNGFRENELALHQKKIAGIKALPDVTPDEQHALSAQVCEHEGASPTIVLSVVEKVYRTCLTQ